MSNLSGLAIHATLDQLGNEINKTKFINNTNVLNQNIFENVVDVTNFSSGGPRKEISVELQADKRQIVAIKHPL